MNARLAIINTALLIASYVLTGPAIAGTGKDLDDAKTACSAGRFYSALASFNRLTPEEKEEGEACYVAGQIYSYLNQPACANSYYLKAKQKQFAGYSTWGFTDDRLHSLAELRALTPPFYRTFSRGTSAINLYAAYTSWTGVLIQRIPNFLQYAEAYFGTSLPPIDFYFFSNRRTFDQFHKDLLHVAIPQSWHDGTGNFNVVLFCEVDKDGRITRPASSLRTSGDVLHEYGHALCATIYGDDYLVKVPQWFNEGMADALAAPYYGELYGYADAYVRKEALTRKPPSYATLCTQLYSDHDIGYAFGRLMVKELLGDNRQTQPARRILENARHSDFESAIRTVTGVTPLEAYNRVVARYWKTR